MYIRICIYKNIQQQYSSYFTACCVILDRTNAPAFKILHPVSQLSMLACVTAQQNVKVCVWKCVGGLDTYAS